MRREDRIRLRHIADALDSVARFTRGRQRRDLDSDEMLTFALVHALQIVGEAAARLSAETKAASPGVPWANLIGMRHRLVHAYFDIDHDILWSTAVEAAPALATQIADVLNRTL